MKELIYQIYQLLSDFIMHIPISFVRSLWARIIFKEIGKGCQFGRHVHLVSPHKICLGKNVFVNRHVTLDGRMGLYIGDNTDIGEYSAIWSLQHDVNSDTHYTEGGKTVVEDHCWIAPHSIILPGRILKKGTVVATGSVVTKNFPPKSVIAGVPAKFIKQRDNALNYEITYKLFL